MRVFAQTVTYVHAVIHYTITICQARIDVYADHCIYDKINKMAWSQKLYINYR